jgi:hypothetical protein
MDKMRKLLLAAVGGVALGSSGCFVNQYPGDKNDRMDVLLVQSENLRQINGEWRRFWLNDQPSHMTYYRTDGGIQPRH